MICILAVISVLEHPLMCWNSIQCSWIYGNAQYQSFCTGTVSIVLEYTEMHNIKAFALEQFPGFLDIQKNAHYQSFFALEQLSSGSLKHLMVKSKACPFVYQNLHTIVPLFINLVLIRTAYQECVTGCFNVPSLWTKKFCKLLSVSPLKSKDIFQVACIILTGRYCDIRKFEDVV